ncbi:RNA-directed DNA polymerase, eukaryota, reverse transcriptase zinc-binding domain protein, partial [Tanacetum coccineum]
SSYARAMIELRADEELKDTIMVAMLRITGDGYYTCTVRVEYEWKPPRCLCCKVFGHTQEECPKNIGVGVAMMRFLALGWILEEIHMTWAHLEKKRIRLQTYTKSHEELCKQWLETASQA